MQDFICPEHILLPAVFIVVDVPDLSPSSEVSFIIHYDLHAVRRRCQPRLGDKSHGRGGERLKGRARDKRTSDAHQPRRGAQRSECPLCHMTKCKVIALANQKGGTAKTTTTLNLGIGLAHQGRKVLLVDADPQGDLTTALGWINADSLPITLETQMKKILQDEPFVYNEGILHHEEGVDIIPTNIELSGMEISLVNAMSREQTLKLYLSDLKKDYDYILIDCMPSLGMLTINALAAADSVIVPVQAHYLPLKGMTQLMKTIGKVQRQLNPNLKIDGVLLTLADMRTKLARTTEDSLRENYGKHIRIFKTVIPVAITAAESSAAGQSIYEYDKNGTVAKAYAEFTREVIQCGEKQRNKHESSLSR